MRQREISLMSGAIAIISVAAFLSFCTASDSAMNKSGLGDSVRFAEISGYAGISFYLAAVFWLLCVGFTQFAPQPYRGRALFWFGLMLPLLGFVSWLLLI
jgi:hypothetical protein